MPRRGPPKYQPFADYLAALTVDRVRLTLPEIEAILGGPLPVTAWSPTFWTNRSPRLFMAQPWVQAGWRMVHTELHSASPAVHFARVVSDSIS